MTVARKLPTVNKRVFADAVRSFWETRDRQAEAQRVKGVSDQGGRTAVTGGAQMAGFATTISELVSKVGVDPTQVFITRRVSDLPGFFRPTKEWDLLIVDEGKLLATIELKSQVGPSFGNNFNNRTEEAIGTATDLWTAYREGALQTSPSPWLGYLFLLEDCPASRAPVRVREPHLPVFPEFQGASYAQRYELFCRRLVLERLYNGACLLMSTDDDGLAGVYTSP